MLYIAKKLAELVGVVLLSALTSLSLNAIFSGLLALMGQSPFAPIFGSNPMLVISVIAFLLLNVLCFHYLSERKYNK